MVFHGVSSLFMFVFMMTLGHSGHCLALQGAPQEQLHGQAATRAQGANATLQRYLETLVISGQKLSETWNRCTQKKRQIMDDNGSFRNYI